MKTPLQITFRGMEPSEALGARIREQAEKLEHYFDGIVGCRVVVEEPHRHKSQGNHFRVRLDLTVPGAELVVDRDSADKRQEDAYQVVHGAFDALRRQLQDWVHARRTHH